MIEGRGIWIHYSTCLGMGGARVARECYEHGFNILLPQVPWLTGPDANPKYWKDIIGPMIVEAHKLGIEVHAWIFFLNAASVDNDTSLMQVLETGKLKKIGCPSNPETVKRNLEKIRPILEEYDLDGFSLEDCFVYHRFQNEPATCFCDYCKRNAPTDPNERKVWNRTQLTSMLRKIVKESKKYSPRLKISAAARVPYIEHGLAMSADWKEWCDIGLLDYLAPMIYCTDNARLRAIARETLQLIAPSRVPVYIGLGAYMLDRELSGHDLWIQVEQAYKERAVPPYTHHPRHLA